MKRTLQDFADFTNRCITYEDGSLFIWKEGITPILSGDNFIDIKDPDNDNDSYLDLDDFGDLLEEFISDHETIGKKSKNNYILIKPNTPLENGDPILVLDQDGEIVPKLMLFFSSNTDQNIVTISDGKNLTMIEKNEFLKFDPELVGKNSGELREYKSQNGILYKF
jgi:hypothetical protein